VLKFFGNFFTEVMENYERRRPTIMTNIIGGHQITMSILYQSTIGDFL
jgi:hypothetical protein